jgi:hypothetical protein
LSDIKLLITSFGDILPYLRQNSPQSTLGEVDDHLRPGWGKVIGADLFGPKFRHRARFEGLAVISGLKGEGDTGMTQGGRPTQTGLRVGIYTVQYHMGSESGFRIR